jgi:DHA1 family multidrug resistance protein-like MFS transporter
MPFLPLYFRELGVTETGDIALWTGVTLGVSPAIAALTAPFWGRVGDRFGSKLMVQRSLISFIAVMIAMAYATRAWHLFALRAIQGFFAGYGPLTLSMAALSAPRDKVAAAIGTVQTAQRMGPTLGPVIGGILAPVVGLRNAFFFASGFYVVALVLMTALYREPPRRAAQKQDGSRMSFASILAFENFLLVMLLIFGLQLVDRSFGPILPLYLGEIGYTPDRVPIVAGVLFSILAFTGALGNQLSSRLLRRHSPRVVIAWTVILGAAALAVFTASDATWTLALSLAVVGLCIGTSITTAYAAGNAVIPPEVHATAFGFLTGAALFGIALSPVLSGLVAVRSIRAVFVVGIVALIVLAIMVRKVMVERNPPVESAPPMEEG